MIASIGPVITQLSWAKSLSWYDQTKSTKIHHIVSFCISEFQTDGNSMKALRIIIGPVSFLIGIAIRDKEPS